MSQSIPGARAVDDPVAELKRLAARRTHPHVALDEFHYLPTEDLDVTVHVTVTTSEPWQAPAGFGARIAGLIRSAWDAGGGRGLRLRPAAHL